MHAWVASCPLDFVVICHCSNSLLEVMAAQLITISKAICEYNNGKMSSCVRGGVP
jgi:hypothetical protein